MLVAGGARPLMSASRKPAPRSAVEVAWSKIYAIVRSIPRGRVATYGEIAELAGMRAGHRIVARAMRSCPERLPWQRVVGKKDARRGQINIGDPEHAAVQRGLLESEGVHFDAGGFIPLARFGWLAAEAAVSNRARPARDGSRRSARSRAPSRARAR
jgi:methylated-DNA-protein-cysteine methyltransferase-like protein